MTTYVWDFLILFFALFVVLVIIIVAIVFRARPIKDKEEKIDELNATNQEKVIVKEIVKIRCRYCGFTYDQGLDRCPNCGART